MIIDIDNREPIQIKEYFNNIVNNDITVRYKNLDQGDFIIRDNDDNIILIIERKSITDLLSSVKDSRYTEQSERYSQLEISSNKIIYIVEGNYKTFDKESAEFKTFYSCIFSLNYYKGFTVLFSDSLNSSCILIEQYLIRLIENKTVSSLKLNLVKKQTITRENINSYMLNLIPGIGINTSIEILKNFDGKILNLINEFKNNNDILNNLIIKSRKISSKVINNIKKYLIDTN